MQTVIGIIGALGVLACCAYSASKILEVARAVDRRNRWR